MEDQVEDELFQEQFAEMMRYRTGATAVITGADIVGRARRRARARALGVMGSAAAVAAVALGVAATTGRLSGGGPAALSAGADATSGAQSAVQSTVQSTATGTTMTATGQPTSATPDTAPKTSPVLHVVPKQQVQVVSGFDMYVTVTEKCDVFTGQFVPGSANDCTNVSTPNMAWHGGAPVIDAQGFFTQTVGGVTGEYLGPAAPALLDVVQAGKHYVATVVETPGMTNWVAYFVALPQPNDTQSQYSITAYDAEGHKLAAL